MKEKIKYQLHRHYEDPKHIVFITMELSGEKYISSYAMIFPCELRKYVNQAVRDLKKASDRKIKKLNKKK